MAEIEVVFLSDNDDDILSYRIIRKEDNSIFVNDEKINIDFEDQDCSFDDGELDDIKTNYQQLLDKGHSEKFARVKASLTFAPYIEDLNATEMEIIDYSVLTLLFNSKITNKVKITVDYNCIYTNKKKKHSLPSLNSDNLNNDYQNLFIQLLSEA